MKSVQVLLWSATGCAALALAPFACSSSGSAANGDDASAGGDTGGNSSGGSAGTSTGSSGSAATSSGGNSTSNSTGTTGGTSSGPSGGEEGGGTSSGTSSSGTVFLGDGGAACTGNEDVFGGFPDGFWDNSNIPAATGPMVIKFLNRTNGKYSDGELYWTFNGDNMNTMPQSFAAAPTFQFPVPPTGGYNGRFYFFICPTGMTDTCGNEGPTDYYDFWEYFIGTNNTGPMYGINYDTTRVDAFAIKIALDLHVTTGPDYYIGENCPTFAEDRTATFASYVASVPAPFQPCGQPPIAPYRITEPGGCGFNAGGPNADYYNSFEQEMWTNNGITNPPLCPVGGPYNNCVGPNGTGLTPDLEGAILRHVGAAAGTWNANGTLMSNNFWQVNTEATFYSEAPTDYYAKWIHSRAIHNKQYAFPYDDSGGNSSDIGANGMVYMLAAVGW
jgi:hypothetical protein